MTKSNRKRLEQRIPMRLAVRVRGMDLNGKLFDIETHTLDVTPQSARVDGIWQPLHRGMNIGIECEGRRARFRVTWVGKPETGNAGEIGVQCLEPGRYIWGVALKRRLHIEEEDVA